MFQTNYQTYGGSKAEEKTTYLNQSLLSGYIQGISSYIPSSLKTSIKKQILNLPTIEGEKDNIVGTYFDEVEILGKIHTLLIICYNNGFQIWDLDNPDGVKEIFTLREGLVKFCRILKNPLEEDPPTSPFYGKRPLLAVVLGEDNPKVTRNMVRIFSLQSTELVNMYKFRAPIYNVLSNHSVILVCLKERIVGFNNTSMVKEFSFPTFPSVSPNGVVALGSRWIAYTDIQSTHHSPTNSYYQQMMNQQQHKSIPQNQTFGDTAVDVATDLAKEVAQKLYYFGDIGRKKFNSYMGGGGLDSGGGDISPSTSPQSDFYMNPELQSVVVVYDYVKKKTITVIKPQNSHPISYLCFDPSGTLLFTCSTEGTKVNVYQIIPYIGNNSVSSPIASNPNILSSGSSSSGGSSLLPSSSLSTGSGLANNSSSLMSPPPGSDINNHHHSSYRHIYVLKRGITNASVQGISINPTSKWVALTTSRGTTHIFAINPLGGDVSIHSHIIRNPNSRKPYDYYSTIPNLVPSLLTLNAMDRIKLGNNKEDNTTSSVGMPMKIQQQSYTSGNCYFKESNQTNLEKLYVVSPTGQLILYELRPQTPPINAEIDPNTLCLSLTPVAEWDVCRKTKSMDYKSPAIPYTLNQSRLEEDQSLKDSEARWLYNVEITTHSQEIKAIWGIPQFSFRNSTLSEPSPDTLSFFDEDYPVGEPIRFEKKKIVSAPSPKFDSNNNTLNFNGNNNNNNNNNNNSNNPNNNNQQQYHNHNSFNYIDTDANESPSFNPHGDDIDIDSFISKQSEIEMIKQLGDAMKTPLNNHFQSSLQNIKEDYDSGYTANYHHTVPTTASPLNNAGNGFNHHQTQPSDPLNIPKQSKLPGFNNAAIYSQSPENSIYPIKSFSFDEESNVTNNNGGIIKNDFDMELLPNPKKQSSSPTTTTTTTTHNTNPSLTNSNGQHVNLKGSSNGGIPKFFPMEEEDENVDQYPQQSIYPPLPTSISSPPSIVTLPQPPTHMNPSSPKDSTTTTQPIPITTKKSNSTTKISPNETDSATILSNLSPTSTSSSSSSTNSLATSPPGNLPSSSPRTSNSSSSSSKSKKSRGK
eukprot:gene4000-5002_t